MCGHQVERIQENEYELTEPLRCPEETGCGQFNGKGKESTRFKILLSIVLKLFNDGETSPLNNASWLLYTFALSMLILAESNWFCFLKSNDFW